MKKVVERVVPRRISGMVSPETLMKDLEYYKEKALEYGATQAEIISTRLIVIDERVRLKCMVPRCHLYGESPNCPPYTPEPEAMRKIVAQYEWAVLFKHDVAPKEDFVDKIKWHKGHMAHQGKTDEIASKVEALAFNDGHYFAAGFGAGGCKTALCEGLICQFLDSGRCRFPVRARPSMEAVGIDVYRLVTEVGWEIYPVAHRGVDPDAVPCAISVGLVLVR